MGLRVKHEDVALLDLELREKWGVKVKAALGFEGARVQTCT